MNDKDPMLGSDEERATYLQRINDMIQADIEQRKSQRLAEFLKSRESPAVLQGASGLPGSMIQATDNA